MKALIAVIVGAVSAVLFAPGSAIAVSHHGLPGDGPAALYRGEPRLPAAAGWPGSNQAFPWTSGTGRLADGGLFWTDYLYDDHGTTTSSAGNVAVTAGTPSFGTYTYPNGPAHNNGADIFRAGVLLRRHATYWRVDWNTLAKASVPIAEWTFDRGAKTSTGGSVWPAGAGVSSPGIGRALVMSSRGARLISVPSGRVVARLPTTVDMAAHSFVVKVPRRVLPVHGRWRIRLAAGLANANGTGFAPAPDAAATQPRVYNVAFRTVAQEKPADNFWDDQAQTAALRTGNISRFSTIITWKRLRHRARTRQPRPYGWSDRWYVSDVNLGPGVRTDAASIADGQPNYLGQVQPYAVYVPRSYRHHRRAPLTFLLHSLTQNQNQYAATTPHFTQQACEARHSICVTTLGRGPDGNYWDYAELDFWQVWHAVASAYRLEPDRTVLSGYSMGGIGTNQLAMAHPDLFARAVTLAGAVGDVPSLVNLRWVPTYLAGGYEDELVPYSTQQAEANRLDALGYRYRWVEYPAIDHVAYELADSFSDAAHYMGHAVRAHHPGRFQFVWTPANRQTDFGSRGTSGGGLSWTQMHRYGVGTTGDYWVRSLHARSHDARASVSAMSGGRPDRSVTPKRTSGLRPGSPEPATVHQLTWRRGARPQRTSTIRLTLHNVRSLRVLPKLAGFRPGHRIRLVVSSDDPVRVQLGGQTLRFGSGHHVAHRRVP